MFGCQNLVLIYNTNRPQLTTVFLDYRYCFIVLPFAIHLFSLYCIYIYRFVDLTTVANTTFAGFGFQTLPVAAAFCHQKKRRLLGLAFWARPRRKTTENGKSRRGDTRQTASHRQMAKSAVVGYILLYAAPLREPSYKSCVRGGSRPRTQLVRTAPSSISSSPTWLNYDFCFCLVRRGLLQPSLRQLLPCGAPKKWYSIESYLG